MKVIITGSTGMVGKGVLFECMEDDRVESILLVNRNPLDMKHPKVKEVIVKDFMDLSSVEDSLRGFDACFFCMGVSSFGLDEETYTYVTYGITCNFAKTLLRLTPGMTFVYVSGEGTDSSEKGSVMWARVKGKTENAILNMGFRQSFMFRPGYIHPQRGIKSKTPLYNVAYFFAKPLYPVFKQLFPNKVTTTANVGRAMIEVAQNGYGRAILGSRDINQICTEASE